MADQVSDPIVERASLVVCMLTHIPLWTTPNRNPLPLPTFLDTSPDMYHHRDLTL